MSVPTTGKAKGRDNLIPWKPGQSGNPEGRTKKMRQIPDLLERLCKEETPSQLKKKIEETFEIPPDEPMSMMEAVLRGTLMRAMKGEAWAVQFISERLEGKALQRVIDETPSKQATALVLILEKYVEALKVVSREGGKNGDSTRNSTDGSGGRLVSDNGN